MDHFPDLPNTQFLDGGTLSFTLAAPIEDSENLIVIDAAQLKSSPGTVMTFVGDEMDDYLNGQTKRSVHEVGLMDLMSIVRLAGHLPKNRALVAIQPESTDWGETPTMEVRAVLPYICEQTVNLIKEWQL